MTTRRPRYLHRPIAIRCNGQIFRFVTIGYLSNATGRSTRQLKRWQALGWFPKPEYFLYPGEGPAQRGLYPEEFAEMVCQIALEGHLGRRLDCLSRDRFVGDVWRAYEWSMEPFRGATPPSLGPA